MEVLILAWHVGQPGGRGGTSAEREDADRLDRAGKPLHRGFCLSGR